MLGQDIEINEDNKLSSENYLPRSKSKSFIYENGDFTLKKVSSPIVKKEKVVHPGVLQQKK